MVTFADAVISSSSRPLSVRMRKDLVCVRHRYQGRISWVVKEPLGLTYTRMLAPEYFILTLLDGRISLDELLLRFNQEYAPETITLAELQQFIGRMHREGLIAATAAGQGQQLLKRRQKKRRSKRMGMLTNLLSIRFRGVDPGWVLDGIYPLVKWFFTKPALIVNCCIMLAALLLLTLKFDVFQSRLPGFHEFFGPESWLLMGMVLAGTKIIHELGHGLACRHFGKECHEIGLLLLVFTPCLYCNVSDSWLLPSKWQRAAIGAAGMYVELVLAALATFGWWFSEPGLLNHLCLQIMFISSISTVMFNGNPLLRYDGYYILSDLIEIPNLRAKANSILNHLLARWFLGMELPLDPFMPQRRHALFALFTIASSIYRWVVVISILWFLNEVLEPYGLKVLGQSLAVVSISMMVLQPLYRLFKFFQVPGRMQQVKPRRLMFSLGLTGGCLLAVFCLPWPHYAGCPLEVRAHDAASIYVPVPAKLAEVYVSAGQKVEQGELLARCESLELDLKIAELSGQTQVYRAKLESLEQRRFAEPEVGEELGSTREALTAVESQLQQQLRAKEQLELRATRSGVILLPPKVAEPPRPEGTLPTWQGSLLDEKNLGAVVPAGSLFCQIGDLQEMEVELYVDQGDVDLVRPGQAAYLRIDALPSNTFTATISALSKQEVEEAPKSLSNQSGGELAVRTDSTGVARPLSAAYTAQARLIDTPEHLQIGLRGWARIHTGNRTLANRIWRFLSHTFNFQL